MNSRKVEGKWKEIKGTVVEKVGKVLGNEKLQMDGQAEKVRGRIESAAASTAEKISKRA